MKFIVMLKSLFKQLAIAVFIILMFIIIPPSISMIMSTTTQVNIPINQLVDDRNYQKAKYIAQWGEIKKILYDDHLKVSKMYGYVKDKTIIRIENKTLIVIMDGYGAILKTGNDSIDIGKHCSKAKGYMGVFTSSNNFFTSEDGQINIVRHKTCSR